MFPSHDRGGNGAARFSISFIALNDTLQSFVDYSVEAVTKIMADDTRVRMSATGNDIHIEVRGRDLETWDWEVSVDSGSNL